MPERSLREIDIQAAKKRADLLRNFQPPEELRKNLVFRMIRALQTSFIEEEGRYPTMEEVVVAIRKKYGVALEKSAVNDLVAVAKGKKEASKRLSELQDRLRAGILLKRERKELKIKNPKREFLINFLKRVEEVGVTQAGEELKSPFRGTGTNLVRLTKAEFLCNPKISGEIVSEIKRAYQLVFEEIEERLKRKRIKAKTGRKALWERLDEWREAIDQDKFPNLGTYWETPVTIHLTPVFEKCLFDEKLSWFDKLVLKSLRNGESVVASAKTINQKLKESPHGYSMKLQPQEIALARSIILGKFE